MHTRRTLMLDRTTWDVTLDGAGRIAVTGDEYATAQNVANESRLFTQDAYFNQDRGIPHFVVELGKRVNNTVLQAYLRRAALVVPDVKEVLDVKITGFNPETRTLAGTTTFSTVEGDRNASVTTYF